MNHHRLETIFGIAGPAAGLAGAAATAELVLKLGSLALGCLVGALSAYSIWLKIQRQKRRDKEEETDI